MMRADMYDVLKTAFEIPNAEKGTKIIGTHGSKIKEKILRIP